ncbi:hypothetical protein [Lewinella cohaerens]|uniref:hypothetical protein n=1 Tax=Lewinella cohaerens TaxID=70995 RepID=UPI0003AAA161|nr:hypothetical protein [Lewinella cohaerens]
MLRVLIMLCFAFSIVPFLPAQKLLEKMGAIETNFKLTSANVPLAINTQYIIERGTGRDVRQSGFAGGYTSQEFFLVFTLSEPTLVTRERLNGPTYNVTFYDKEGKLLARIGRHLIAISNQDDGAGDWFCYSLSLRSIPFALLDITARVEITIL